MKHKKPKPTRQPAPITPTTTPPPKSKKLSSFHQDLIAIGFLVVSIIIMHAPIFLNQKIYDGGDSREAIVKTNRINQYYAETGEVARWNPYPETGIPNVFFLPKPFYSLDFYLSKFGDAIGIAIVYLLLGAIGMYYLLRFLRFNVFISVALALCFVLAPYYRSLIIVGQFLPTKFQAVMLIPWIVLAMVAFFEKQKLLYACLFSLALGLQLLTQHYQVIYYTGILLLAIAIHPLVEMIKKKSYSGFFRVSGVLLAAAIFSLLLSAYPLFVSKKYNEASIRAKWGIDLKKPVAEQGGKGVSTDFIRDFSPGAGELTDLLIPAASGGSSKEKYNGSEVPELSGSEVNAYWGKMTFSFSYMYFGLALILATLGLAFKRNAFVISLSLVGFLFVLWSLGTSLEGFYMFFYDFLPFFKNFRTPPTSMAVVYFILCILAAYGLQFLFETGRNTGWGKKTLIALGAFFILGFLIYMMGSTASFLKTGQTLDPNYASQLQRVRKDLFMQDIQRYFILLSILSAIVAGYYFKLIKEKLAIIGTALLLIIDLLLVNSRYTNELMDGTTMRTRYYPSAGMKQFFEQDKEVYRVFPVSDRGRDLSAYVPIVGDHDLQVLTRVFELNTNNLYQSIDSTSNINWNTLTVFGVKYFVCDREAFHPQLIPRYADPVNMEWVYQFNGFRSFGHFVNKHTVVPGEFDRLRMINNAFFNPSDVVIIEKDLKVPVSAPDTSFSRATRFTPNEFEWDLFTDKQAIFVMPVPFVKDGWEVYLDEKEVKDVLIANHYGQAIIVPPGNHKLKMIFNKSSFTSSYWISAISWLVLYAVIIFLVVRSKGSFFHHKGTKST